MPQRPGAVISSSGVELEDHWRDPAPSASTTVIDPSQFCLHSIVCSFSGAEVAPPIPCLHARVESGRDLSYKYIYKQDCVEGQLSRVIVTNNTPALKSLKHKMHELLRARGRHCFQGVMSDVTMNPLCGSVQYQSQLKLSASNQAVGGLEEECAGGDAAVLLRAGVLNIWGMAGICGLQRKIFTYNCH